MQKQKKEKSGLHHKIKTKVGMHRKLQEALEVLQMPKTELRKFILEQSNENPFFEMEEPHETDFLPLEEFDSAPEWNTPEENIDTEDTTVDIDWELALSDRISRSEWHSTRHTAADAELPEVADVRTLLDSLEEQLRLADFTQTEVAIGQYLIENIDDNGHLDTAELTLADIAKLVGCTERKVKRVLRKIQDTFEPTGIAYRDTREALIIQIRNWDKTDGPGPHPLARDIIVHHFEALLNRRFDEIADALNVDSGEIEEAVAWLGTLTPYPGRAFTDARARAAQVVATTADTAHPVVPDVEIRELEFGKFSRLGVRHSPFYAILADGDMPHLKMNADYVHLLKENGSALTPEERTWLEERYEEATDVLNSIAHRGRTIVRVTEAIFDVQSAFLTHGIQNLYPLTLQDIADKLGIHASTVSRVTSNKYVQTPYGTFPLRAFFSSKVATRQGGAVSANQVKRHIQTLIRDEEPTKPLSDQGVSDALRAHGILLARRTVQKYRDELGIPPSRERVKIPIANTAP